jgi:hypothetical protein
MGVLHDQLGPLVYLLAVPGYGLIIFHLLALIRIHYRIKDFTQCNRY